MCTNKCNNLVDHFKNIRHQYLNQSKLHLTKRGTKILLTTFVQEISSKFQWQFVKEWFLVVVFSLDIDLIAKTYTLKLTI